MIHILSLFSFFKWTLFKESKKTLFERSWYVRSYFKNGRRITSKTTYLIKRELDNLISCTSFGKSNKTLLE